MKNPELRENYIVSVKSRGLLPPAITNLTKRRHKHAKNVIGPKKLKARFNPIPLDVVFYGKTRDGTEIYGSCTVKYNINNADLFLSQLTTTEFTKEEFEFEVGKEINSIASNIFSNYDETQLFSDEAYIGLRAAIQSQISDSFYNRGLELYHFVVGITTDKEQAERVDRCKSLEEKLTNRRIAAELVYKDREYARNPADARKRIMEILNASSKRRNNGNRY